MGLNVEGDCFGSLAVLPIHDVAPALVDREPREIKEQLNLDCVDLRLCYISLHKKSQSNYLCLMRSNQDAII